MSTAVIIRRFRKEIRERPNIQDSAHVVLSDDPQRAGNTLACELLLHEVFGDRITVSRSPDGIVCGSREEAAMYRLYEYTRKQDTTIDLLLSEIPVRDIASFLLRNNSTLEVFVPESPEQRFISALSEEFSDITYGL